MTFSKFLLVYIIIFAVLVIAGGVQGFLVKGSKISIIIASILGACALGGAYFLKTQPSLALVLAGLAFLGVAGRFFPAFLKAADKAAALWPAGLLGVMGVAGLCMVIYAFVSPASLK
jgi:uncharacterized membrane protein (UPF0136 family)